MALKTSLGLTAALAAMALSAGSASAASDPRGIWLNDTGRGAIEIKDCDGGLCGYVVWVKEGNDAFGCGKKIIDTVRPSQPGVWDGGRIYSPDRKKWYDVDLKPLDSGKLKVTGHALFLSKTMLWTPAPADLVRCDAGQASAAPVAKSATAAVTPAKAQPQKQATQAPVVASDVPQAEEQVAEADVSSEETTSLTEGIDLEKGINLGDAVSIKKLPSGKCQIKAPFVNLTVDCDRATESSN
jgi:uncharacterized protein (DUF2147 family)